MLKDRKSSPCTVRNQFSRVLPSGSASTPSQQVQLSVSTCVPPSLKLNAGATSSQTAVPRIPRRAVTPRCCTCGRGSHTASVRNFVHANFKLCNEPGPFTSHPYRPCVAECWAFNQGSMIGFLPRRAVFPWAQSSTFALGHSGPRTACTYRQAFTTSGAGPGGGLHP